MPRVPPFRTFTHSDGRRWDVRVAGVELNVHIHLDDGESIARTHRFRSSAEATTEEARLIAEQLQDGFVETTKTPGWEQLLDSVVAIWTAEDPSFDAEALRRDVLAASNPSPRALVEAMMDLAEQHVYIESRIEGDELYGAYTVDDKRGRSAAKWLRSHLPTSASAVLLALRHPDSGARKLAATLSTDVDRSRAVQALLSTIEHPGSRGCGFPEALITFGMPEGTTAERLIAVCQRPDTHVGVPTEVCDAARVLSELAGEPRFLDVLLEQSSRARRHDSLAWSLMRAAEVSRDVRLRPHLEWMRSSKRFTSAGYRDRIRDALAGLRT